MSVRRPRVTVAPCAVQPALPLGHVEVRWDALPRAVQDDVLARWCELLHTVITSPASNATPLSRDVTTAELQP